MYLSVIRFVSDLQTNLNDLLELVDSSKLLVKSKLNIFENTRALLTKC